MCQNFATEHLTKRERVCYDRGIFKAHTATDEKEAEHRVKPYASNGRSSGQHRVGVLPYSYLSEDAMSQGRVHSYESFGTVDGPGIRFVLFLQGCPMRCKYCHNPDTWEIRGGTVRSAEEVAAQICKYRRYFGEKGGVTVSGGEPMLQAEFVCDLFALLKEEGIHTCLDTSGVLYREGDETQEKLLALTDLVLLDIKHIDAEAHRALTGWSNESVLALARRLSERKKPFWVRHVLVPGCTDDEGALRRLKAFLQSLVSLERVEVLPYHTMGVPKYERLGIAYPLAGVQPPSKERVERAKQILL